MKIPTIILITLLIGGCTPTELPPPSGEQPVLGSNQPDTEEATQELKKFENFQELRTFLTGQSSGNIRNTFAREVQFMAMDAVVESASIAGASKSASDFSQTNVQVQGVDEADFVKNDDKYIYVLTGDTLAIIDAFPAENAKILSEIHVKGSPRDLFINEERLIVFTQTNDQIYTFNQFEFWPSPRYTTQTHALVYDITDKEHPELEHDYTFDGNYLQSRMIGKDVYVITNKHAQLYDLHPPRIMDATTTVVRPEVYYFDNPEDNYQLTTVASFNTQNNNVEAKTFLMGYANTIYVSEKNIYITYQKNQPYWRYETDKRTEFFDVVLPLLPNDVRIEIKSIEEKNMNQYEEWDRISETMEDMYNTLSETQKENLLEEIQEELRTYQEKREEERRKTVIHKINIKNGNIDYDTRGEVKGQLLNQFSMDEQDNNLRVATTSYLYTRSGSTMHNNVYVLDEDFDIIGDIERIAPDERIYSTRFLGDRLYMVTFKRIDPFFVIDLSDARNPKILGELKIPGFSDYLHPYDENHIIGIGKEVDGNEWGGISVKGVKLALFDVSDVENPRQVDMVEIGTSGSDSEALHEHKAFLFDREKNLLVIPVREVKENYDWEKRYGYKQRVWQGAYVFTITDDGFEKRGKVAHYEGDEESRWYWGSPSAVRRSLFMDDVLYTISQKYVKMNDLEDLDKINEIKLPYSEEAYPAYYDDVIREIPVLVR